MEYLVQSCKGTTFFITWSPLSLLSGCLAHISLFIPCCGLFSREISKSEVCPHGSVACAQDNKQGLPEMYLVVLFSILQVYTVNVSTQWDVTTYQNRLQQSRCTVGRMPFSNTLHLWDFANKTPQTPLSIFTQGTCKALSTECQLKSTLERARISPLKLTSPDASHINWENTKQCKTERG